MSRDAQPAISDGSVRVWDRAVRMVHWALVLAVIGAWVTFRYAEALGDGDLVWHKRNGYAVLVLVVFRLLWGVVGPSTARFASFVPGPGTAAAYAWSLVRGAKRRYLGHNPLGALMIVALIAVLLAQATFGLFASDEDGVVTGPLNGKIAPALAATLSRLHHLLYWRLILPLVGVHILANVLYGVLYGEPLIRAMVTGRKPADDYVDGAAMTAVPRAALRLVICLGLAAAVALGPVVAIAGRL